MSKEPASTGRRSLMSARGNSLSSASFVWIVWIMAAIAPATTQAASAPETPAEMVATYETLATVILGAKDTEANLVRSILAATNAHAEVELGRAKKAIAANDTKAAQAAIENLAADVGQLATEGDNAVAGIRKRLLEGGHHHNAAGEAQGIFDEGYVIVTKAAKKSFLESSKAIAGMTAAPKAEGLDAEWKKVQATYSELMSKK
jgi:hypothetical protein